MGTTSRPSLATSVTMSKVAPGGAATKKAAPKGPARGDTCGKAAPPPTFAVLPPGAAGATAGCSSTFSEAGGDGGGNGGGGPAACSANRRSSAASTRSARSAACSVASSAVNLSPVATWAVEDVVAWFADQDFGDDGIGAGYAAKALEHGVTGAELVELAERSEDHSPESEARCKDILTRCGPFN